MIRPTVRVSRRAWCHERHDGAAWLLFDDGQHVVGARVAHQHGNPIIFEVGAFAVMLPVRGRELFVVADDDEGVSPDPGLPARWAAAGRPEWRAPRR